MRNSEEYLSDLDLINEEITNEFLILDSSVLNWKPGPEKWSVGQCLDHIIVTNESYGDTFNQILSGKYTPSIWARINPFSGYFGRFMTKALGPERRRSFKTFPVFEPASSDISLTICENLKDHNRKLKLVFSQLLGSSKHEMVIRSPASPIITYKIKDTIAMLVQHEKRHLAQAKEVLALQKTESLS